jgi:ABC-type transporter Mla subunit MlaD
MMLAPEVAASVLALSKTAWRLGITLSKLDYDTKTVNNAIQDLAGDVKSLSNECDVVYAKLEEVLGKSSNESALHHNVDARIGDCLASEVQDASRTIQELELFLSSLRGRKPFIGQAQRLNESKDQVAKFRTEVCGHTDNLRITLVLINT